jgi:hypothetical protein
MAKSIKVNQKKRGRPATGRDPVSAVRLPTELTTAVDKWGEANGVNRSEAIRRLVELGLTVKATKPKQPLAARADRAKELASKAIDKMGDPTAHPDDRDQRRARLTKGSEEFRKVPVDRRKAKGK